ncbi:MAG: hypothetical protein CL843_12035 [Crocinitomicaceae bacterium]|nr:hypothetical protein [Crocinitomicaceae bacterium]
MTLMHKRELYKTALISSPIMAAFVVSPIYLIVNQHHNIEYGNMFLLLTTMSLLVWFINIALYHYIQQKWLRLVISYGLLLIIHLPLINLFSYFFPIVHNLQAEDTSAPVFYLYPIINIMALNTIVIMMANAIMNKSKQSETQAELDELKIKHLEAEQQQLINQLQPHFLFNSLSTLKSLISQNSELAEGYTLTLSDFLRFTVSAKDKVVIPLIEEINFTRDYIHLIKTRYQDSFFMTFNLPETILTTKSIPVYALQTLIENAIKHNAFTDESPLRVSISYQNEQLIVKNNILPKFKPSTSVGIGLKNLTKRYEIITNQSGVFIEQTENWFIVAINLLDKNVESSNR